MALASIEIPNVEQPLQLSLDAGRSTLFIGANGSGKTRLGVFIEKNIQNSVRISAQRSLILNDDINAIGLDRALNSLREGSPDDNGNRAYYRWKNKPATAMLNDFDSLLQALFAEQTRTAVEYLDAKKGTKKPITMLQRLRDIWEQLLPHRKLKLRELSIDVSLISNKNDNISYKASQLSDGERLIFYMIGHCLLAKQDATLIVDEPELHVHKAILASLWDLIEAERPDCAFVYITHDLDFVASRPSAAKYVVNQFMGDFLWDINLLPEDDVLPERLLTEIIGSRRPVLFLEGTNSSIDLIIYRAAFVSHLVQPVGSCDAVIHSVVSYRKKGLSP